MHIFEPQLPHIRAALLSQEVGCLYPGTAVDYPLSVLVVRGYWRVLPCTECPGIKCPDISIGCPDICSIECPGNCSVPLLPALNVLVPSILVLRLSVLVTVLFIILLALSVLVPSNYECSIGIKCSGIECP